MPDEAGKGGELEARQKARAATAPEARSRLGSLGSSVIVVNLIHPGRE